MTDANLLLGRLDPDHFLGGEMKLDLRRGRARDARSASPIRSASTRLQRRRWAFCASPSPAMSYAVKGVTTERGLDAGAFTMVVLWRRRSAARARAIAQGDRHQAGCSIPFSPGYFSAYGMLFGDLRYDYVRSCFERLATVPFGELETIYAELEQQGREAVAGSSVQPARGARHPLCRHALCRPGARGDGRTAVGTVCCEKTAPASRASSTSCTCSRYGTSAPKEQAELVSLRVTVTGVMRKPPRAPAPAGDATPPADGAGAPQGCIFRDSNGFVSTPVYQRTRRWAQQDQRPRADRGACLHHRSGTRRRDDRRPFR